MLENTEVQQQEQSQVAIQSPTNERKRRIYKRFIRIVAPALFTALATFGAIEPVIAGEHPAGRPSAIQPNIPNQEPDDVPGQNRMFLPMVERSQTPEQFNLSEYDRLMKELTGTELLGAHPWIDIQGPDGEKEFPEKNGLIATTNDMLKILLKKIDEFNAISHIAGFSDLDKPFKGVRVIHIAFERGLTPAGGIASYNEMPQFHSEKFIAVDMNDPAKLMRIIVELTVPDALLTHGFGNSSVLREVAINQLEAEMLELYIASYIQQRNEGKNPATPSTIRDATGNVVCPTSEVYIQYLQTELASMQHPKAIPVSEQPMASELKTDTATGKLEAIYNDLITQSTEGTSRRKFDFQFGPYATVATNLYLEIIAQWKAEGHPTTHEDLLPFYFLQYSHYDDPFGIAKEFTDKMGWTYLVARLRTAFERHKFLSTWSEYQNAIETARQLPTENPPRMQTRVFGHLDDDRGIFVTATQMSSENFQQGWLTVLQNQIPETGSITPVPEMQAAFYVQKEDGSWGWVHALPASIFQINTGRFSVRFSNMLIYTKSDGTQGLIDLNTRPNTFAVFWTIQKEPNANGTRRVTAYQQIVSFGANGTSADASDETDPVLPQDSVSLPVGELLDLPDPEVDPTILEKARGGELL